MTINEILANITLVWFMIGAVLILFELIIPGFVLFFFGLGAWITSVCFLLFEPSINIQILIFFFSSILLLVLLRRQLKSKFFKEKNVKEEYLTDEFIGKKAEVISEILPTKPGRVSFRGTLWTAQSDVEIKEGETVEIIDKESICLIVKPNK